jgi:hypothetical protein
VETSGFDLKHRVSHFLLATRSLSSKKDSKHCTFLKNNLQAHYRNVHALYTAVLS